MKNFRACWCEENGEVQFGNWTSKASAASKADEKRMRGWVAWVENEVSERVS